MDKKLYEEALRYHIKGVAGKIEVISNKSTKTEKDLSLAYSPGVAAPCEEINKSPEHVYDYTAKGNLVAVVSNGSAVLGLGNIGPLAAKPVMEGKGVLFKQFADINVFDIEVKTQDVEEFITTVKNLEPTFGGVNLEDIKAPECFEIEERLKKEMNIPVFHDDQHGTAIITGAAFLNACHLTDREISKTKVVFNGAGSSALSCARILISLGVKKENIIVCDSHGVIYEGRTERMNKYKENFMVKTSKRTLEEALDGACVFIGLSVGNVLKPEALKTMTKNPIIFALANPFPEIDPNLAKETRPDCIIATGRSDFPNQVNNVLGFPGIFRGALDVQATTVNEEMKLAAAHALAKLAREDVPEDVSEAYDNKRFHFGVDYIIPKPFDPRVLQSVAPAVAKAAMDTKVAKKRITSFDSYRENLETRQSFRQGWIRKLINELKIKTDITKNPCHIVFSEGENLLVLKALQRLMPEKIIKPVLLGNEKNIKKLIEKNEFNQLKDIPVFLPKNHPQFEKYANCYYEKNKDKISKEEAYKRMEQANYFSSSMVEKGEMEGMITGLDNSFADCIRPLFRIIGTKKDAIPCGVNIVLWKKQILFFADSSVNINPTAEELADITLQTIELAKSFQLDPQVAMLSFTNFSAQQDSPKKMALAKKLVEEKLPGISIEGEIQADAALNYKVLKRIRPETNLKSSANILIFPNLDAGNIAYKILQQLGGGEVLGPFLMGLSKPANIVQRTGSANNIFNSTVMTVHRIKSKKGENIEF